MGAPDHSNDTIAAIATPAGRGGVGVIRISGPDAGDVAESVAGSLPPARLATLRRFRDGAGNEVDQGLLLWFPAPGSYTGEYVAELQGHGGPVVMQQLLSACVEAGARLAEPGEFTRRAWLNGRLDLAQAEAVADLIDAGSREAAGAAIASLEGLFSARVNALVAAVIELRTWVEAAIDFTDEDIDFLADDRLLAGLQAARDDLDTLLADAGRGRVLRDGIRVVILGQPNVGKSSLLNRLAASDAAIVTEIPGTTRDLVKEEIVIDGLRLQITDTAGLRDSGDAIEQEGMRRSHTAAGQAELVLLMVDDRSGITGLERELVSGLPGSGSGPAVLTLFNKCDLSGEPAGAVDSDLGPGLRLSAASGEGFEDLISTLKDRAGLRDAESSPLMARQRHVDALDQARTQLGAASQRLKESAGELAAEELRLVQQALGRITGEFTTEDLLGEIFASFCVGK